MMLSLRAARKGGRVLTVGNTGGPRFEFDNRYMFGKHLSLIGSTMSTRAEFATVMGLVFAGKLKPVLDDQFALADIRATRAAATPTLENRRKRGWARPAMAPVPDSEPPGRASALLWSTPAEARLMPARRRRAR
jgi:hypothetical protein